MNKICTTKQKVIPFENLYNISQATLLSHKFEGYVERSAGRHRLVPSETVSVETSRLPLTSRTFQLRISTFAAKFVPYCYNNTHMFTMIKIKPYNC